MTFLWYYLVILCICVPSLICLGHPGPSGSSVEEVRVECLKESNVYCSSAGSAQLVQCLYDHRTSLSEHCGYYLESLSFGQCNSDALALCGHFEEVEEIQTCLQQHSVSVDHDCKKNLDNAALVPLLIDIVRLDFNQRTTLVVTICTFYIILTIVGLGWVIGMTLLLYRKQAMVLIEKRRSGPPVDQQSFLSEAEQGEGGGEEGGKSNACWKNSHQNIGIVGLQDLSYHCSGSPALNFEEVGSVIECGKVLAIVGWGCETLVELLTGRLVVGELIGGLHCRGKEVTAKYFMTVMREQGYADWNSIKTLPSLSVWQTLLHCALLVPCSEEETSFAMKNAWSVMQEVGLLHAAGSALDLTLSQKIRLVIGIELLRSPQLLVCRELLHNLSSVYAHELLLLLQEIARRRHISVVFSVSLTDSHKVSASEAVDEVMVLGKAGKMIFCGGPSEFIALHDLQRNGSGSFKTTETGEADKNIASGIIDSSTGAATAAAATGTSELSLGETLRSVLGPAPSSLTSRSDHVRGSVTPGNSGSSNEYRDNELEDEEETESLLVSGGNMDEQNAGNSGVELVTLNSAEAEAQAQLRGFQAALRIRFEESSPYLRTERRLLRLFSSETDHCASVASSSVSSVSSPTSIDVVTTVTDHFAGTVSGTVSADSSAAQIPDLNNRRRLSSIRPSLVPPLSQIWVTFSMNVLSGGSRWWKAPVLLGISAAVITLILALTTSWDPSGSLYQAADAAGLLGNVVVVALLLITASIMHRQPWMYGTCGAPGPRVRVSVWAVMLRDVIADVLEAILVSIACLGMVYTVYPLNPSSVSIAYFLVCMIVGITAWQAFLIVVAEYFKNSVVLAVLLPYLVVVSSLFNGLNLPLDEYPLFLQYFGYLFIPAVLQRALVSNDLQCCYLSLTCNALAANKGKDPFYTPACPIELYFTGDGSDGGNLGRHFLSEQGIADDRPAFLLFVLFISGVAWRAVSARMRQSQQQRLSRLTHHVK